MNGAKHRFALGLTCFFLIGITVVYPFLLYTPNAFVTRWREWYIETAMGTMTHQWLATWFIPEDIINEVMTKRYLMNQKQEGIVSNWDGAWEENEEDTAETPKDKFYAMNWTRANLRAFWRIIRSIWKTAMTRSTSI